MYTKGQTETHQLVPSELISELRQYIRGFVSTDANADCVLDRVLQRIHQRVDSLCDVNRLHAWLYQVTRNVITDHYRRQIRIHQLAHQQTAAKNNRASQPSFSGVVGVLLSCLSDEEQRAVTLYELDGISLAAIAERECVTVEEIQTRVRLGRERMESVLRECSLLQCDGCKQTLSTNPCSDAQSDCQCEPAQIAPR